MKIYRPQWDENDIPRVGCPHREGIRIGSKDCKTCEHLSRWIDRPYEILVECEHPEAIELDNIAKATRAIRKFNESLYEESRRG